jgi:hypothetical protein
MIERLSGLPADILGVRAVGTLTLEDYETVIAPIVDEVTRGRTRLRALVEVGPGFEGVTPAAAWDDVRLGLRALRSFDGCAVVSDHEWIRTTSRVAGAVTPFPVRAFPLSDREAALGWLTALPTAAAITARVVEPGVVIVEVREPLRTEDFALLGQTVDAWLAEHAVLPGVVLHSRRVPGWATPGSFARHIGFVLGHHRRIERIALAVGGRAPAVLAPVAGRVLHPEVRRFGFDRLDDAVGWAAGSHAG